MKFINSNYKACVQLAESKSDEEKTWLINQYPTLKNMVCGLVGLIRAQKEQDISVDDWECDFSNAIWRDIQKKELPDFHAEMVEKH